MKSKKKLKPKKYTRAQWNKFSVFERAAILAPKPLSSKEGERKVWLEIRSEINRLTELGIMEC